MGPAHAICPGGQKTVSRSPSSARRWLGATPSRVAVDCGAAPNRWRSGEERRRDALWRSQLVSARQEDEKNRTKRSRKASKLTPERINSSAAATGGEGKAR